MITTLTRTLNPPGSICGRTRVQQPSNPVILINARAEQMILYRQYTRNKSSVLFTHSLNLTILYLNSGAVNI